MKKSKSRIVEVIAVIISIVIIFAFTVIPQFFTCRTLKRMERDIDVALERYKDGDICKTALSDVRNQYEKHKDLLLMVYHHADVSDLEFAIDSAEVMDDIAPQDESRLVTELKRVQSCVSTLIEKEQFNIMHLL